MKKKLLLGVLSVATAICMAFGLSACGEDPEKEKPDDDTEIATPGGDETSGNTDGDNPQQDGDNTQQSDEETLDGFVFKAIYDPQDKTSLIGYSIISTDLKEEPRIQIPATYKEKPVIWIEDYVFKDYTLLENITIPDGIIKIGSHVFENCDRLTSIVIPDSVKYVGEAVFKQCPLVTASMPAAAAANILPRLTIKSVVITSGTAILPGAFKQCASLTSVTLPDTITSIGEAAFERCSNLTEINLPDGITSIGHFAFKGCTSLEKLDIPNTVTFIDKAAFNQCSGLSEFIFPNKITTLSDGVIQSCAKLTSVTIPDSVIKIETGALSYCSSLTEIIFEGTIKQWNEIDKTQSILAWNYNSGEYTVYCTDGMIARDGKVTKYSTGLEFALNEEEGSYTVVGIGSCEDTEIVIPAIHEGKRVTAIGENAFFFCYDLTNIIIPNSVASIGDYAFSDCYGLTRVTIPDSVTSIGSRAFNACKRLTELFFQGTTEQWKTIQKGSYWYSEMLTRVYCSNASLGRNEY